MTDSHADRPDDASRLSLSEKLDEVCDQFEAAWKAGEQPRIEEYLVAWHADPAGLFAELLPLELELRDRSGQPPAIDEYLQRFPDHEDLVRAIIGQADTIGGPDGEAETTDLAPGPHGLKIRCPHCRNPIELVEDRALAETTCPSCGSTFGVTGAQGQTAIAVGKSIGHFELLEQLGTGGFGTVYRARDTQLDRLVALKIPRRSQLGADEIEKFIREARAAAQLQHPNIVSVHEVGREGETVYIVSDLIEGLPLNDWIEDQQLTPREAAALCQKIALALHHAHEAGVVHRDLKPSNIMIDGEGEPHIMDFGLAKREAGEITMTVEGQILGTPAYMSPEQARGEGYQADRRSDVYSLGVILYELLTGERPFRGNVRMLLKAVVEDEPVALRKLDARIPRDLETIALKCLEKVPSKRYATADGLAGELERFDRGEPIRSRPISQAARAWRWCKRNRSVASLSAAVFLVLVVGLIGVTFFGFEALKEKRRADDKTMIAVGEAAAARRAEEEASFESHRANTVLHRIQIDLAFRAWQERDIVRAEQILAEVSPPFQESWETRHIATLCQRATLRWKEHIGPVNSVCFSPDGKTIASGSSDGTVKLWNSKSRREKLTLRGHADTVSSVCFSPDGMTIVSGSWDMTVKLWDARSGEEKLTLKGHTGEINSVCFSPDGKSIASGSWDKMIKLWDSQSGKERLALEGHLDSVNSVCFSPNGETILSGSSDGTLKLWDTKSGKLKPALEGRTWGVNSASFSPDGRAIAIGTSNGALTRWNLQSGNEKLTFNGHSGSLKSVCFSPNGKSVASGSSDGSLRLWDAKSGQEKLTLKGHAGEINGVCFSPDGKTIVSGNSDGTLVLWDIRSSTEKLTITAHGDKVKDISFSPDGNTILSGSSDKTLKLWDAKSGELKLTLKGHTGTINSACFSPDGKSIASGSSEGTLKLWDAKSGQKKLSLYGRTDSVNSGGNADRNEDLAFFPVDDENDERGEFESRDAQSGQKKFPLNGHTGSVNSVTFSPDGKTILSGSADKTLKLWDANSGELKLTLKGHTGPIFTACFSPDGKSIVSGGSDGALELWDTKSGQKKLPLKGHIGSVNRVTFSPDGKTILSGSADKTLKLWDANSGELKLTLKGHTGTINSVSFSPDGKSIVSGSDFHELELPSGERGQIKLWDALSGQEKFTLKGQTKGTVSVCFSPDGKTIASGSTFFSFGPGEIKLWDTAPSPITPTTERDVAEPKDNRRDRDSSKNVPPELAETIPKSVKRRIHVVALAAGDYATGLELESAIDDAKSVIRTVKEQSGEHYTMGMVETLFDHQFTRENVEKLSTKISHNSNEISPDDLVLIYLGGHGVVISGDYYFVPPDPEITGYDEDLLKNEGIPWEQLRTFDDIPCRKVFMIDAGFQSNSMFARGNAAIHLMNSIRPSRRAETIVLTSCGLGETSWESNDLGHGFFTLAVLEALQGYADGFSEGRKSRILEDGIVELQELVEYVKRRVPQLAKQAGVRQIPNSSGHNLGHVPLVGKLRKKED